MRSVALAPALLTGIPDPAPDRRWDWTYLPIALVLVADQRVERAGRHGHLVPGRPVLHVRPWRARVRAARFDHRARHRRRDHHRRMAARDMPDAAHRSGNTSVVLRPHSAHGPGLAGRRTDPARPPR